MHAFLIPDDFRAFMQAVVVVLDGPADRQQLDAEDALDHACGYGGRIGGADTYRFRYLTHDGHHRWDVIVREAQIRDIADGLLIEVEGERFDIVRTHRRTPVGAPLLVWGENADDALSVHNEGELLQALDALHLAARTRPQMLRMWTAADDQLVAALWGDQCALYIVDSAEGYATSMGNQGRTDSFTVTDHEGRALNVPWAECVSWEYARRALVRFIDHSDLGEIPVEGRIPTSLLMMGDFDRAAALAARAGTPRELSRSSLPRMLVAVPEEDEPLDSTTLPNAGEALRGATERAAWAGRVLDALRERVMVELAPASDLEAIRAQLGGLLRAHARDAEHSLELAAWLVTQIAAVPGINAVFATATDLQGALRRARIG